MTLPVDTWLADEARRELRDNILPFWRRQAVDHQQGGFVAERAHDLRPRPDAPRGLILNARLLWTFSAVFRHTQAEIDAALARRAYDYLTRFFWDPDQGGFFWEVDAQGRCRDDKKKIYGQAFGIYALTEYHRTFGETAARQHAIALFRLLESHSHDAQAGGYVETLTRRWQPCEDVRLSDQDLNEKKSMNNHLHVLEAYARLLPAWPEPLLAERLRQLIGLFSQFIVNAQRTHFHHFFNEAWVPQSQGYTFGHDIEGSWLLCEAAEALGDPQLGAPTRELALSLATAALHEGLDADGGLLYEGRDGRITDPNKEWWPQAEAVVGFLNAWQLNHDPAFLDAAARCWRFIQQYIVDRAQGDWYWRVTREGSPDLTQPKISTWKCPYHNSRCCLEMMKRLSKT